MTDRRELLLALIERVLQGEITRAEVRQHAEELYPSGATIGERKEEV